MLKWVIKKITLLAMCFKHRSRIGRLLQEKKEPKMKDTQVFAEGVTVHCADMTLRINLTVSKEAWAA